jgi:hypothetical protein
MMANDEQFWTHGILETHGVPSLPGSSNMAGVVFAKGIYRRIIFFSVLGIETRILLAQARQVFYH